MYRFVVDPENQVLPDLAAKLPGRGLWIKADRFSLQSAIEKKLFDKITRQNLKIKEGLIIELCLLYTSPSPRDRQKSRMPSSA